MNMKEGLRMFMTTVIKFIRSIMTFFYPNMTLFEIYDTFL